MSRGFHRSTKQTTATTTSGWSKATITLRVHPRYGQEVRIIRTHGPDALWVEAEDGEHNILPAAWTDWRPRADLAEFGSCALRIAPEAAQQLAAYVAARRGNSGPDDGTALGPTNNPHASAEEPTTGRVERRKPRLPGDQRGRHRAPAPMVEQAGAPKAPRGSSVGRRGAR